MKVRKSYLLMMATFFTASMILFSLVAYAEPQALPELSEEELAALYPDAPYPKLHYKWDKLYQGETWKPKPEDVPKWQQFAGETVYVATENTPPSLGMYNILDDFTKLTGMKVDITLDLIDELKEKIFLDLRSGAGGYHVNYGQTAPIGTQAAEFWSPINMFADMRTGKSLFPDLPDIPDIPEGTTVYDAFTAGNVDYGAKIYSPDIWIGMPYDTAMYHMFYRKDLFEKYNDKFIQEYGKPLVIEGMGEYLTWDDWYDMSVFFNKYVTEVDYAMGFVNAQNWAINLNFQTLLRAWGVKNNGFEKLDPVLGSRDPGRFLDYSAVEYKKALDSLIFFKKLYDEMHPDSVVWGWDETGNALCTEKVAMLYQCGEYVPIVEDPTKSMVAGRVGYAVVPTGPGGAHAYAVGAAPIAVNATIPLKEQKKGYLYVLWTTGPVAQHKSFEQFSGTPVRGTVYEYARKRGWDYYTEDGQRVVGIYLKVQEKQSTAYVDDWVVTKIPTFTKYLEITGGNISKALVGRLTPKAALDDMITRLNRLHGYPVEIPKI
ncbi:hypothetical protein IBX65_01035 [Candidatus Aerophobetes bacterium]|nr:hypothetical protein [Candidatus Aerophobetes bacterium]